jgi:hypothetical protein
MAFAAQAIISPARRPKAGTSTGAGGAHKSQGWSLSCLSLDKYCSPSKRPADVAIAASIKITSYMCDPSNSPLE